MTARDVVEFIAFMCAFYYEDYCYNRKIKCCDMTNIAIIDILEHKW